MTHAGVILKTVERCNINCTYCYYFNSKDQSYKDRRPIIKQEMIDQFIDFLKQGVHDLNITSLIVELHGGEPLMQRKNDFAQMCQKIQDELVSIKKLKKFTFALQTNGILIDEEWIEIFKRYNIGVGISLDGPRNINDQFRLDKSGKGTYDKVIEKIKLCQKHNFQFGLLSVINPNIDGKEAYKHFAHELKLNHFDFLIPDANHSNLPIHEPEKYGKFMSAVFDEWSKDNKDKPKIFIRFCVNAIELFLGRYSRIEGIGKRDDKVLPLICVSNNGDLGPLDELRTCLPEMFVKYNIKQTSWKEFLQDDFFTRFLHDMSHIPNDCEECCWQKVCGGGTYAHRYDELKQNFSNKSVYCAALKYFYKNVLKYFLANGYTVDKMKNLLSI